eukprot:COSAG04_NODE_19554_length_413_cov_1.057325_1_plen_21_part_10
MAAWAAAAALMALFGRSLAQL